jgi:uncharacterized membrane protein
MDTFDGLVDEYGAGRLWLGSFVALVVVGASATLALPRLLWDRFLWHYFWGPVFADAKAAPCAVMTDSGPQALYEGCAGAIRNGAIVAEPGYTIVSEIGYMLMLIYTLIGIYLLLNQLEIVDDPNLYFAFVPFMLLGGALRVVEDGTDRAVEAGVAPLVEYPLSSVIISPVIYATVFLVALTSLTGCIWLQERGIIQDYYRWTAGIGTTLVALTLAYLTVGALTTEYSTLYPSVLLSTVGIATGLSYGIYRLFDTYAPEFNSGTGYIGLVVLWGHAIDGVANVLLADWLDVLGVPLTYYPKHPANEFIIAATETIQPASVSAAIGTSWPFLLVKLGVASMVVWLFNDEFLTESPRYALLLLIAVTAVGLGPGTRDMLRATFGI